MTEPAAPRPATAPAGPSVLVVGETLVDVVRSPDGTTAEHVGGSPANVAVGLARLGHRVTLATRVGRDDRGRRVADHLRERQVALATPPVPGATSTATAVLDDHGAATYDFDLTWDLPPVSLRGVDHLHTGSLGAVIEPGASAVLDLVGRARATATVSYDPNLRAEAMGGAHAVRSRIEECIGRSDVVKASIEDVEGLYAGAPASEVAHLWGRLGPALVVVTLGARGALVHLAAEDLAWELPAREAAVVDTVGAGDSFMAGLVSGLVDAGLLGGPDARQRLARAPRSHVEPAVRRALACARWTVERAGAAAPARSDVGVEG